MKRDQSATCPHCGSAQLDVEMVYETKHNGARLLFCYQVFRCQGCAAIFSETRGTPMEQIKGADQVAAEQSGWCAACTQ